MLLNYTPLKSEFYDLWITSKLKEIIDIFRHTRDERIYHEPNYIPKNVKENLMNRRKVIPDGNIDLHKGMKSTVNDNYMVNIQLFKI